MARDRARRFGRRRAAAAIAAAAALAAGASGAAPARAQSADGAASPAADHGRGLSGRATIAVAANFLGAAEALSASFAQAAPKAEIALVAGSTGKLFAQISQGAPFDAFLAADAETPARAVSELGALEETRFTYAVGALALYSPHPEARLGPDVFSAEFRTLAIANPATAPYGRAARQTLERLGVWEALQPRLALSPNVSAAYTVAAVGAAEFALVAVSLLEAPGRRVGGAFWRVPAALYDPIRQDAVLLAEGAENMVAAAFLAHLQSPEGRAVIAAHGYRSAP